jgi:hypothetical protein
MNMAQYVAAIAIPRYRPEIQEFQIASIIPNDAAAQVVLRTNPIPGERLRQPPDGSASVTP